MKAVGDTWVGCEKRGLVKFQHNTLRDTGSFNGGGRKSESYRNQAGCPLIFYNLAHTKKLYGLVFIP
jgi:hypothetical protein